LAHTRFLRRYGDSYFYLFVPEPNWTDSLAARQFIGRFSSRLAGVYGGLFDGFFQHHHLYPAYVWKHLLEGKGFRDVEIVGLGSKAASRLFEHWLIPAFFSFAAFSECTIYPCICPTIHGRGCHA
jgi:hypothetical protein